MKNLFDSTQIGSITVKNRFVRSATWEGLAAENGAPTAKLTRLMVAIAKGDVGLIISSHAYVNKQGQASRLQLGIDNDELIPEYKKLTDAVHQNGGKIVLQITHGGMFSDQEITQQPCLVVSNIDIFPEKQKKEITIKGIQNIINDFSEGARRAYEAGFDGVQLHSAHGYFLNQFLSPAFNLRTDDFGGSIENRTRIHTEILKKIRTLTNTTFPILIKLNGKDFVPNGLDIKETLPIAKILASNNITAIETSGGFVQGGKLSPSCMNIHEPRKEAYFKRFAKTIKEELSVPIILVGGNRSMKNMQDLLEENVADYFSLSRPLICEPNLIKRWKNGDKEKSQCISCNRCFQPGIEGKGVFCVAKG